MKADKGIYPIRGLHYLSDNPEDNITVKDDKRVLNWADLARNGILQ